MEQEKRVGSLCGRVAAMCMGFGVVVLALLAWVGVGGKWWSIGEAVMTAVAVVAAIASVAAYLVARSSAATAVAALEVSRRERRAAIRPWLIMPGYRGFGPGSEWDDNLFLNEGRGTAVDVWVFFWPEGRVKPEEILSGASVPASTSTGHGHFPRDFSDNASVRKLIERLQRVPWRIQRGASLGLAYSDEDGQWYSTFYQWDRSLEPSQEGPSPARDLECVRCKFRGFHEGLHESVGIDTSQPGGSGEQ